MGLRAQGYLNFQQQVILEYLMNGSDPTISTGTDHMIEGAKEKGIDSVRITLLPTTTSTGKNRNSQKIRTGGEQVKGPYRLYLRGHGDWEGRKLGNRSASEVTGDFGTLTACTSLDNLKLISITGCELARSEKVNGTGTSTISFASEFHKLIGAGMDQVKVIPLFARTETVSIVSPEVKAANDDLRSAGMNVDNLKVGSKLHSASKIYKKPGSKLLFYWMDGKQMAVDAALAGCVLMGGTGMGDEV